MPNMSYCRFQNTAQDLEDCVLNLRSLDPSANGINDEQERDGRARIIELAAQILAEVGVTDPHDQHEIDAAIEELNTSAEWEAEEE